jgi:hypothetical protein
VTGTITGLLGIGVLVVIGLTRSVTLRANLRVWGRPLLAEDEFAARHFPEGQRAIAAQARRLLAPYLPVNAGRIEPSDRLVEDLGLAARLSHGLDGDAFARDLEEAFGIEFSESDFYEMRTLRDVVNLVAGKNGRREDGGPSRRSAPAAVAERKGQNP